MQPNEPLFASVGQVAQKIDVRLSYRIVELFSEGLYASPNKAIEELVANSFDAGARHVQVLLSPNLHDQGSTIVVIDDGQGMGIEGLKQHWLIGVSNKRKLGTLPLGRQQIGQFGIGKLATYVLAERLSHISKFDGKFYATSMDYRSIDHRVEGGIESKTPIKLDLRELSEAEAKYALKIWTDTSAFKASGLGLFGRGAPKTWTVAIMSSLKQKVHEIKPGILEWVLCTALPLRDDFSIWLNDKHLESSKRGKGVTGSWVLGKDFETLPKPAPSNITAREDKEKPAGDERRYGLEVEGLGRVTGYAEAYRDLLTGKSDEIGRSYGFFVYILGRLINVDDGHFGISPDELRHGTFGRFRLVVNIDSLDKELRSNREVIRTGPLLTTAQNLLRAIFNFVRPHIEKGDDDEAPGAKLSRRLAASPASLSRRPIVDLARAVLAGRSRSRYLLIPRDLSEEEKQAFLASLEKRAQEGSEFVTGLLVNYDASPDAGIAQYDTQTGNIRVNAWHPFVSTFHDEFVNKNSRHPLELLAMAEVLLEAHLFAIDVKPEQIEELLAVRDLLLRNLANQSSRKSPFEVARALKEARNDADALEQKICDAFASLGCDSRRIGGRGEPDGVAVAILAADSQGNPRQYSVSLESKSKVEDKGTVSAGKVDIAAVIRHREKHHCQHAIVVGRSFPTTKGIESALATDIADDRLKTKAVGEAKTITLITIDDLAELVRLRPIKQIGLQKLRKLFECGTPEETHNWLEQQKQIRIKKPPYKRIVETIEAQQKRFQKAAVKYAALRVALSVLNPPIDFETDNDLSELCKAMAQMSEGTMYATSETVELDQSTGNVLKAIEAATKEYEADL
jgi:Histidine kinase-, DNA gyrase B-, and HSP90-like ATPase